MTPQERFQIAHEVRDMYLRFRDFCLDAMLFLGFKMTWMQLDIADFMQDSPNKAMVAAQRGEAKSTIACIYVVWCITQNPATRAMLVSGSGDKAEENGQLITKLIMHWDLLAYLRPEARMGDRTSATSFDVNWALKGVEKSASINCIGITAALQGYRADILIPDDIETTKNGLTATERAKLTRQSQEFTSICTHGKILYLGTPQSRESIYNGLPARGFLMRIWPGRFPTLDEQERYGDWLAPSILARIARLEEKGHNPRTGKGLDGTRGWAADPQRYNEEDLLDKELDQGPEGFQLQYMLDTSLADEQRMQLKLRDLLFIDATHESVPEQVAWAADERFKLKFDAHRFPIIKPELYLPALMAGGWAPLQQMTMFVDPAGDGGDELSYAVGGTLGPYIHVVSIGGWKGGFAEENLEKCIALAARYGVKVIYVEKNLGAGAVGQLFRNHMRSIDPDTNKPRYEGIGVEDRQKSGQKERRIIDTLRPIMQRHRLIFHVSAMDSDHVACQQYPADKRNERSVFHQIHNITTDRGSLPKDDRIDALEGLVRELAPTLVKDDEAATRAREEAAKKEWLNNPMGYTKSVLRSLGMGRERRKGRPKGRRL
ncbi:terminase large subunit [Pseudomonas phage vB_PaeM_FBPa3]|uniref:Terminase large subunit n=1 Tax=Pseudomonas phage vB_PaeM_FBPa3 TaxID=2969606 RepID=A0A9E7QMP4_9CAUD|nr:terminase large subunit [Pseudomonas phage vB_PaeM_FBPa3]UVN13198.1 terminase large subunit [Pseudomonas phage vB_PaeP_FBPa6]UVN13592.1 terminase large subunit [Pseudomonas phage vB_PaeP_FBPa18]